MKLLIRLINLLLTLSFLLLVLAWFLSNVITLNQFNSLLNTQLSAFFHQPVAIKGDIKLSAFPKLGIFIPTIEIGTPLPQAPFFAKLDGLFLRFDCFALLKHTIHFNALRVHQYHIEVHLPLAKTSSLYENTPPAFHIHSLSLENGSLLVTSPDYTLNVNAIQVTTQHLNLNKQPFAMQLTGNVTLLPLAPAKPTPLFSMQFEYRGQMTLSEQLWKHPENILDVLTLNGQLRANQASFGPFSVSALSSTLQTQASTLLLNPVHCTLYRGDAFGDITIDTKLKQISMNQHASNTSITDVLRQTIWVNPIRGNTNFSMHTLFNYAEPNLLKTIMGNGHFTIRQGTLYNVNLETVLHYAKTRLHALMNEGPQTQGNIPPLSKNDIFQGQTDFQYLTFDYHLTGGTIESNQFIFDTRQINIRGTGRMNMITQTLSASIQAHLKEIDPQIKKVQQILGGSFPMQLNGPIQTLQITPDMPKIMPYLQDLITENIINSPIEQLQHQLNTFFNPD